MEQPMTPPPTIAMSTAECISGSATDRYFLGGARELSYRANGHPAHEVCKSCCLYTQLHVQRQTVRRFLPPLCPAGVYYVTEWHRWRLLQAYRGDHVRASVRGTTKPSDLFPIHFFFLPMVL